MSVEHLAALPYREVSAFMSKLREDDDAGARAFDLMVLTSARTSEVLRARWSEFELEEQLWVIPKERTKYKKKEHRVPLTDAALAIVEKQRAIRSNDYVFAGRGSARVGIHILDRVLKKRLGRNDVTVHGFRSTFCDWAADETSFPHEIIEMALAHRVKGESEGAYCRSDVIEKRRALAEAWVTYCAGGEVIDFPAEVRRSASRSG